MTQRQYTLRTPSQWLEHIQNQAVSGLTISTYCQQHGLAASNFYHWRKRLLRDATSLGCKEQAQPPKEPWVTLTPAATEAPPLTINEHCTEITLSLPGGIELTILAH